MDSFVYRLLRQAIIRRQQVEALYHGLPRRFCPHAIGRKRGRPRCLVYQFAGRSRSRAIVPGAVDNWRCLDVDELRDVRVRDGAWYTAWNAGSGSSCIDELDLSLLPWS